MKTRVQIIATERRENVYEGNRKSISYNCQCVVLGDKVEVGVLRISHAVAEPFLKDDQLPVGFYDLEYGLTVSFKDRSVGGQLKSINFVADGAKSPIGRVNNESSKAVAAA